MTYRHGERSPITGVMDDSWLRCNHCGERLENARKLADHKRRKHGSRHYTDGATEIASPWQLGRWV